MADFFPPDDSDGAASSSDPQVEARYTVHGQITVNRLFSVPRMSRMINPTSETMNRVNPTTGAESEGNTASPAAGGTSSPPGNDVSPIQLNLRPLTTESQVKNKMENEGVEGVDVCTSTEGEQSEVNSKFQVVLDRETKIPQLSEQQEPMVTGLSPSQELTPLQEASEKEGKEEEKAPAPHWTAKKEPVGPQPPEEQEPVAPHPLPEKEQKATLLPPGKQQPVPQPLPKNEEKIPQLPPEMEPSAPQPPPEEEQKVPQLSLEKEPSVPQPRPRYKQKIPQLPPEMEPSAPQPPPEEEQKVPQLSPEKEPSVPQPRPRYKQKIPQLPPEMEPSAPQPPPEEEQKVPQLSPEKEPSVPQPRPRYQQKIPQLPPEKEPSVPQSLLRNEQKVPQSPLEMEAPVSQPLLEKEPPVPHPQILKEPPVSQLPPMQEPITSQPPGIKELSLPQSLPEKSLAIQEHFALQKTSPYKRERSAFQEEKETVIQSETKAWPRREDTFTSVPASPKPKPAAVTLGGKGVSLNDTVEDLASHLRQVGNASKSAMASSISSFVDSEVGQVFAHTIDRALEKSEEWLDYYLPESETNVESCTAAEEEHGTASEDLCKEGCFMRINYLSAKMRNRAFKLVLHQLKTARQAAKENLSLLDQLLDVLEHTRGPNVLNIVSIPESLQNLWAQWGQKQEVPKSTKTLRASVKETPSIVPELELKALDLTRILAQQLYGTYRNLLPHVTDLPSHLQEKVIRVYDNMEELQSHFATASSLRDLPSSLVIQSRQKMAVARENLDEILDFMAQNPAANWLSQPNPSTKGKEPKSSGAERQPKGRNPQGKAREESSTSWQSSSPSHL